MHVSGTLDLAATSRLWKDVARTATQGKDRALAINLADLTGCDTAGATMLLYAAQLHGGDVAFQNAETRVADVLALVKAAAAPPPPHKSAPAATLREILDKGLSAVSDGFVYLGQVCVTLMRLPTHLKMMRPADLLRQMDQVGVQGIPLVLLLGVLIGLILAFQSLVPMKRFGADIYVANLVALGLVRELGPLLTAVVLSGRSGSAFAAEIGTMKVNQELDAMATMGIDSMTMLVLPRLIAAVLVTPILAVFMELAGLFGMSLVLTASGVPMVVVINQVSAALVMTDFFGGLFKASLFGAAVAAIGCRAGLGTGVGPRAVGLSATKAVVGGIVASIILDGILAVLFYRLGI